MPAQNAKPDKQISVAFGGFGGGARFRGAGRGFTLVELLVVIAILVVLLSLMLGALSRARASASAVACCANLRQIRWAVAVYAGDHGGRPPDPGGTGISWESSLRLYNSNIFPCPADEEIFSALGSSYAWRDTGNPET